MSILRRFIWNDPSPRLLSGEQLRPDPELVARNEERIRQAKAALGQKWIVHPANKVRRAA
jgi:hypothetical protein